VLNHRSGEYFYAHAFNILSCNAFFLLVQIQNRLYSISSFPLKAGPVRACRALASNYTYDISIIVIACLVGIYLSLILSCTELSTVVSMSSI
jgi:hypothetical protein